MKQLSLTAGKCKQSWFEIEKDHKNCLALYSLIMPFDAFEISCIEHIMENGAFALLEKMLHFPYYFQKYSKLNLNIFLICFNVV